MAAHLWELALRQKRASVEFVNVLHVLDGSGTQAVDDICANAEDAWVTTNSFADVVQTDSIQYVGWRARDITAGTTTVELDWQNATDTGSASTETMPPSVAMCYTVRTTLGGKSHRGRIYLGGIRHNLYNSTQTAFDLGGSAGILASGAGEAFRAALDGNGIPLHVYSRKLSSYQVAFTVLPHAGLASQRKRANRYAAP